MRVPVLQERRWLLLEKMDLRAIFIIVLFFIRCSRCTSSVDNTIGKYSYYLSCILLLFFEAIGMQYNDFSHEIMHAFISKGQNNATLSLLVVFLTNLL